MSFPPGRREDEIGRQAVDLAALIAQKTGRSDNDQVYGAWTYWAMPRLNVSPTTGYVLSCVDSTGLAAWASVASVLPANVMLTDTPQTVSAGHLFTGAPTFDGTAGAIATFKENAANATAFLYVYNADTGDTGSLQWAPGAGTMVGFPAAGGTVVTTGAVQNVTNKSFTGTTTINAASTNVIKTNTTGPLWKDNTDLTKTAGLDLSGQATATKTTLKPASTANRTVTIPDATDTLVGKSTTDTLANKTSDASCSGVCDSASSGFSLQDTGTATKRMRFLTANGSGNQAFNMKSTGRTFDVPETGGATNVVVIRTYKDDGTGKTAGYNAPTFVTPAAGFYRISMYAVATTGVALSTMLPSLQWTDDQAAQNQNLLGAAAAFAVAGTAVYAAAAVYCANGTNIIPTYNETGTSTYNAHTVIEQL